MKNDATRILQDRQLDKIERSTGRLDGALNTLGAAKRAIETSGLLDENAAHYLADDAAVDGGQLGLENRPYTREQLIELRDGINSVFQTVGSTPNLAALVALIGRDDI
jgi:hypothetical protein